MIIRVTAKRNKKEIRTINQETVQCLPQVQDKQLDVVAKILGPEIIKEIEKEKEGGEMSEHSS